MSGLEARRVRLVGVRGENRQHVLEMPAPVVADALGYHQVTTAKLAAQAGGTFSRYAPGDHQRPPARPSPGEGDS